MLLYSSADAAQRCAIHRLDLGQVEFVTRIVPKMFSQAQWDRVLGGRP